MKIKDLSKTELLSFIYNNMDIDLSTEVGCAACGSSPDFEYYYGCDKCSEVNKSIIVYAFKLNPNHWESQFETMSLHVHKKDAYIAMRKKKISDYKEWYDDRISGRITDMDNFPEWVLYKIEEMKIS